MKYQVKFQNIHNSILLIIMSIIIVACGGGTEENKDDDLQIVDASKLDGIWVGQYECGQGLTGLTLSLSGDGESVDAIWDFYGVVENPDKPLGSAKYSGSYDLDNNLSLSGVEWVNKPSGYVMTSLLGKVDTQKEEITGKICDNDFTLKKMPPPELTQVTGEWVGTYTCAQGLTGIILSVDDSENKLNATFNFFGLPQNPNIPVGNFSLDGIFDSLGNIDLEPVDWINRPSGWNMEGIEAKLNLSGNKLDGKICGNTSTLEKVEQPISSENITGEWKGSYTCPQGETGLTLAIDGSGKDVSATFSFYEINSNPGIPSGSFEMQGIYNGSDIIDLEPTNWIDRPSGYNSIGFEASIDTNTGTLSGKLCSSDFTLTKE